MAAIWNLPVIFYCINNGYGISTPISSVMRTKHVYERAAAYGVPGVFIEDGNDLLAVRETMDKVIKDVRAGKGPVLVEASPTAGMVTRLLTLVSIVRRKRLTSGRRRILSSSSVTTCLIRSLLRLRSSMLSKLQATRPLTLP